MRIAVKLFGPQARAVGRGEASVEVPGNPTCAQVRSCLRSQYPQLVPGLDGARFALNGEFVPEQAAVAQQDEVALIGQVSGG